MSFNFEKGDEYEALSKPIKDWTSREVALW